MTSSVGRRISCSQLAPDSRQDSTSPLLGMIFNIQRYSLNDGQGIRSVVFFKGCPHRCPWCANPESLSRHSQTVRRLTKCLYCQPCGNDVDECPSGALERVGTTITVDALLQQLLKDDVFYRSSGGGVTLSGGEVLMQSAFASELLQRLQRLGIHTAIETAGDGRWEALYALAAHSDQVLFDLKIMDAEEAKRVLNLHLPRVLANFSALIAAGIKPIPRLPLIPGYTLSLEHIERILDFLAPFALPEIHLLPFHQYGEAKYRLLGLEYPMRDVVTPSDQQLAPLRAKIEAAGYRVVIGG